MEHKRLFGESRANKRNGTFRVISAVALNKIEVLVEDFSAI